MADKTQFKKAELNKKFVINLEQDTTVRLPSGKQITITDIEDEQDLQGMINRKSNLVSLKTDEVKASKQAASEAPKP